MTYIAIIGFLAILGSLAAAMYFMLKGGDTDKQDSKSKANKMARALAFRVGFWATYSLLGYQQGVDCSAF
jgi:hypothetical protein